ncbi:MAG: cation-transporting P-type ATPase [Acidimicrobiia bacterium]
MGDQIAAGTSAWQVDSEVVARELDTDASLGLTTAEAATRLNTIGPNRLKSKPRVPPWGKLLAQLTMFS